MPSPRRVLLLWAPLRRGWELRQGLQLCMEPAVVPMVTVEPEPWRAGPVMS